MSWWTDFRDAVTAPFNDTVGKALKTGEDIVGGALNKITGRPSAADTRKQNQMITDQISAYRNETELTRQQLNETRAQTDVQNRRIQEKQIRSLRRNFRSTNVGMLGVGQPATEDMNTKLGG